MKQSKSHKKQKTILRQDLAIPDTIRNRLDETYAGILREKETSQMRKQTKKAFTHKKKLLTAAIACTALLACTFGVYAAMHSEFFSGAFGPGTQYDSEGGIIEPEDDNMIIIPHIDAHHTDEATAQRLIGAYVQPENSVLQAGDYTITVLNQLFDAKTRCGSVYVTVEQGGKTIPEIEYWRGEGGTRPYDLKIDISSTVKNNDNTVDARTIFDKENSTDTRACFVVYFILSQDMQPDDSLRLNAFQLDEKLSDFRFEKTLDLTPVRESLPAKPVYYNGEQAGWVSAIGLSLFHEIVNDDPVEYHYELRSDRIAFSFKDGSAEYVLEDQTNITYNWHVGFITRDRRTTLIFNRLVDMDAIDKLTIDGKELTIG